jgi:hypothetical protein
LFSFCLSLGKRFLFFKKKFSFFCQGNPTFIPSYPKKKCRRDVNVRQRKDVDVEINDEMEVGFALFINIVQKAGIPNPSVPCHNVNVLQMKGNNVHDMVPTN